MGAAGVALAAAATHAGGGDFARTAAQFLVLARRRADGRRRPCARRLRRAGRARLLVAGSALALGTLLFSGDLAMRGFVGAKLFPFAAPIGGSLMILVLGGARLRLRADRE